MKIYFLFPFVKVVLMDFPSKIRLPVSINLTLKERVTKQAFKMTASQERDDSRYDAIHQLVTTFSL
jgi:hypothetical protein